MMMKTRGQGSGVSRQGSGARSQGPGVRGLCVLTTGYWLLTTVFAPCSVFAKTFDFALNAPVAKAETFTAYHGETIRFNMLFSGAMSNVTAEAIYYQTNGMAKTDWFHVPGTVFHPTNDCGAAAYRFFIKCSDPDGRDYTANGTLRMLDSPGFEPSAIELPAKVLDFAALEVENAPWPAEIEAAIAEIPTPDLSDYATHGEVADAISGITETDPVWEAEKGEYVKTNDLESATNNVVAVAIKGSDNGVYSLMYTEFEEGFTDTVVFEVEGMKMPYRSAVVSDTALDTPQVITNTVTKEFVEDLGIKPADPAYSWVRPDAWAIDVEIDKAEIAGTATIDESGTDAAGRVYTNVTYSTTYQMAAQCLPRMLDESSIYFPIITSWAALPPGGTIDENGHFTAATSGLYRVSATAEDGVTKYADVAISAERTVVTSNEYAYVDDDAAFLRHGCHTNALALLDAADTATTNYYGTTEYVVWNAYKPRFISTISGAGGTDRGPGDDRCFAVSAHILASASHHWPKKYNAQEFSDGANTYTVTKQQWVDLQTWATSHGFTDAEAAAVNDLSLILCTGDAIPDACRPYFISPEAFERRFGSDAAMLTGWRITQLSDWAMPIVFKNPTFTVWNQWGNTRRDLRELITAMRFDTYPAHSGDSGLPIFLLDGTREIVVAHHTSVAGCRADYIAGFRIIKAFVEAYGETIKEVE